MTEEYVSCLVKEEWGASRKKGFGPKDAIERIRAIRVFPAVLIPTTCGRYGQEGKVSWKQEECKKRQDSGTNSRGRRQGTLISYG